MSVCGPNLPPDFAEYTKEMSHDQCFNVEKNSISTKSAAHISNNTFLV